LDSADPTAPPNQPSDSLSTFAISFDVSQNNVDFNLVQLWPSGGSYPRHFSFSERGEYVAVANQNSNKVVIMARDIDSGKIGTVVSNVSVPSPVNVVWDET
jgi:6-phosphogluconolactonase (cycloisomerase 2 family)